jgi:hypothetical protein
MAGVAQRLHRLDKAVDVAQPRPLGKPGQRLRVAAELRETRSADDQQNQEDSAQQYHRAHLPCPFSDLTSCRPADADACWHR